ncbi:hypothetical protein FPV67DRAFT_1469182 [Lyophyllum atratum]|nr:hypothetical protein FPV67DRAFT_1469182 [Lyophyllum atratum]
MDGGTPFNIATFIEDILTGNAPTDPLQPSSSIAQAHHAITYQPHVQPLASHTSSPHTPFELDLAPMQNQTQTHRQAETVYQDPHAYADMGYWEHPIAMDATQYPLLYGREIHPEPPMPMIDPTTYPPKEFNTFCPPNVAGTSQSRLKRAWDEIELTSVENQLAQLHAQYQRQLDQGRQHAKAQVRHAVNMMSVGLEKSKLEQERLLTMVAETRKEKERLIREVGVLRVERVGQAEQVCQLREMHDTAQRANAVLRAEADVLRTERGRSAWALRVALEDAKRLQGEKGNLAGRVKELEVRMERMEDEWRVSEAMRMKLYWENERLARELKEVTESQEAVGGALEYPDARDSSASSRHEESLFGSGMGSRLEDAQPQILGQQHTAVGALEYLGSAAPSSPRPMQALDDLTKMESMEDAVSEAPTLDDEEMTDINGDLEYPDSSDVKLLPSVRALPIHIAPTIQPVSDEWGTEGSLLIKSEDEEDEGESVRPALIFSEVQDVKPSLVVKYEELKEEM